MILVFPPSLDPRSLSSSAGPSSSRAEGGDRSAPPMRTCAGCEGSGEEHSMACPRYWAPHHRYCTCLPVACFACGGAGKLPEVDQVAGGES